MSDKQRQEVETAAQAVLDARAAHPTSTLADLYDPLTMPPNLLQAHRKLDGLVDKLYGLKAGATEGERFKKLFEMYEKLVAPLVAEGKKGKGKARKAVGAG